MMDIKKTCLITSVSLVIISCLFWDKLIASADYFFPLTNVQVEAPFLYVSKQAIEEHLTPYMHKGLLHVDKKAITQKLTALPWVKHVSVKRIFPDTLSINLIERRPIARFNDDALLDEFGKRFPIGQVAQPMLPQLKGNAGSEKELLQDFKKVSRLLSNASLSLTVLEKKSSTLLLTMRDGLKLVVSNHDANKQLTRFIQLYPELTQKKSTPLLQVDLRYKHGLAVKWKPLGTADN
tara:strand:- start:447 stop:1154 length:708 start_codon:yes stop_codon:yes gene_type:complete